MSRDDMPSIHWTPQVRQMPQQNPKVSVLAWTVGRINRTGNKRCYILFNLDSQIGTGIKT